MGVILRIHSEFYTNLTNAFHTIDVWVTDADLVVASTWILAGPSGSAV
jgi:hypothetical protein